MVTGTLIEGALNEGDMAEILPTGQEARVRNLQVHGKDVTTAYAGQRVAVNLAGIKKTDLARGNTIARPGAVRTSLMLDVRLQNLKNSQRTILNGSQVHLYHGSTQRLAKVVLLDRDALQPGESCYAQLRMTEEIAAKCGDRFVIRFYSPLETIGGGVVLDDHPRKHKQHDPKALEILAIKESGSGGDKLMQTIAEHGHSLPSLEKLAAQLNQDSDELQGDINTLCSAGKLLEPLPGRFLAASVFDKLWDSCRGLLEQYHKQNPLHAGMKAPELRQKLLKNTEQAVADAILGAMCRENKIKAVADRYAIADFTVRLTKKQNAIREKIMQIYKQAGLEVPNLEDIYTKFSLNEQTDCKQVVESLVSGGGLVMLTPQLCIHNQVYAEVCRKTKEFMEEHQEMTLAQFRDMMGTSRKYALAVLEYYDKNKILKKDGDIRRMGLGF